MKQPKIVLALGSGGARGYAHIGVLQVLEELGVPIYGIAGASMGSVVGAFYASGMGLRYIESLALHMKRRHLLDFTMPKMGFVTGGKVTEMLHLLTKGLNFEDLVVKLAVVATDLENGERVVFQSGPVYQAVRASISIPGIFVPARIDGRLFIDGGVIDRVPIRVARDMGADIVVGVDVGLYDQLPPVKSIFDVILQSIDIMEREIIKMRSQEADFLIRPNVGHISSTAFTDVEECIELGRQAMRDQADALLECIRQAEDEREEYQEI
ncbi:patatin-like phospholipase family protein [Fodinisporobacter ferrooxydans]|uniref:Patatin-like phospholipase family protein n=1 Tax=Fodinisporobacter ferrooxydans TaxID=2901836 RepID=A0ABY4CFC1_9BACL|nr:patatin-like phospholipase family protein [Alicyclobacillaceae bacterium MYW30-H2]